MGGMECEEDTSANYAHMIGIGAYERFDVDGFPDEFPLAEGIVHGRIGAVV